MKRPTFTRRPLFLASLLLASWSCGGGDGPTGSSPTPVPTPGAARVDQTFLAAGYYCYGMDLTTTGPTTLHGLDPATGGLLFTKPVQGSQPSMASAAVGPYTFGRYLYTPRRD